MEVMVLLLLGRGETRTEMWPQCFQSSGELRREIDYPILVALRSYQKYPTHKKPRSRVPMSLLMHGAVFQLHCVGWQTLEGG